MQRSNYLYRNACHLLLPLGLLLGSAPLAAAEIGTLGQAVDYALGHNRVLAANADTLAGAEAQVDGASGRLMPRLDLSTGVSRTDLPGDHFGMKLNQQRITAADFAPARLNNPGYITNYQTRVDLTMPIYQGGALWAGKRRAVHQAGASQHGHLFMRQQVIYQTVVAYVGVRQARAQHEAVRASKKAAEKRHQDAQAMHRRGMLIDSDVMDANVHLLRAEVRLKQAENNLARSREQLRLVLGLDESGLIATETEAGLKRPEFGLDQAVEMALASRSDLRSLEARQQAAEAAVSQVRAAFLPQVNLFASQQWNADRPTLKNGGNMVGAMVSMNIFSGGSDRAEERAARAQQAALEMQIADLRQQIGNEVADAWRRLDESRLRRESEAEALSQSQESLRIKSLRYQQGLATTADLLDAQAQADNAEISSISAGYDVIIAEAALWLAVGALDVEVIR